MLNWDKVWEQEFRRRMTELIEWISPTSGFQINPEDWPLPPDIAADVEVTLSYFKRVLPLTDVVGLRVVVSAN